VSHETVRRSGRGTILFGKIERKKQEVQVLSRRQSSRKRGRRKIYLAQRKNAERGKGTGAPLIPWEGFPTVGEKRNARLRLGSLGATDLVKHRPRGEETTENCQGGGDGKRTDHLRVQLQGRGGWVSEKGDLERG